MLNTIVLVAMLLMLNVKDVSGLSAGDQAVMHVSRDNHKRKGWSVHFQTLY